ncbi:ABC transporter permease subunit [Paracoccaceae bacterium GXU_MW_L88]
MRGVFEKIGLSGRALVIAVPMLWLLVFFLIPFLVVFKISFSEAAIAMPPYLPLVEWSEEKISLILNLSNYVWIWEDPLYRIAYLSSIKIAAISTVFTLLVGYPMAYYIATRPERMRNILLMLVILPFWTSFLLRVYAWIGILKDTGILNKILMWMNLIDTPLTILYTPTAVYIGIVYTYLPFMILPLYATLSKLDGDLREAAADLGAGPIKTFLTITLPLSMPGIIAGCMLVFIPAIGEYVIPELLGGSNTLMIGKVLWQEYFSNRDWPVAAAVATAMLVLIVLPFMLLRRYIEEAETS